jgi:hypothetical protein
LNKIPAMQTYGEVVWIRHEAEVDLRRGVWFEQDTRLKYTGGGGLVWIRHEAEVHWRRGFGLDKTRG